jgi:hypothetical protein
VTTSDSPDAGGAADNPNAPRDLGTKPAPPDLAPHAPQVGDPCAIDSDCGPGRVCLLRIVGGGTLDFPGGYCTQSCRATACPTGSVCQLLGAVPLCVSACPPTQCRQGYRCCGPSTNECLPLGLCD